MKSLFLIFGPHCGGKSTLMEQVEKELDSNYKFLQTYIFCDNFWKEYYEKKKHHTLIDREFFHQHENDFLWWYEDSQQPFLQQKKLMLLKPSGHIVSRGGSSGSSLTKREFVPPGKKESLDPSVMILGIRKSDLLESEENILVCHISTQTGIILPIRDLYSENNDNRTVKVLVVDSPKEVLYYRMNKHLKGLYNSNEIEKIVEHGKFMIRNFSYKYMEVMDNNQNLPQEEEKIEFTDINETEDHLRGDGDALMDNMGQSQPHMGEEEEMEGENVDLEVRKKNVDSLEESVRKFKKLLVKKETREEIIEKYYKLKHESILYLQQHDFEPLFQYLLSNLIMNMPGKPVHFMLDILRKLKSNSSSKVFDENDIRNMFVLSDVYKKGVLPKSSLGILLMELGMKEDDVKSKVLVNIQQEEIDQEMFVKILSKHFSNVYKV